MTRCGCRRIRTSNRRRSRFGRWASNHHHLTMADTQRRMDRQENFHRQLRRQHRRNRYDPLTGDNRLQRYRPG